MESLLDEAENFSSKGVASLLRSAPDVRPNIKHVEEMFKKPNNGKFVTTARATVIDSSTYPVFLETDDLVPEDGVDERYDEVMSEIKALEKDLNKSLKKLEEEVGCAASVNILCLEIVDVIFAVDAT